MSYHLNVNDIREELLDELLDGNFVTDKSGVNTVEIINACFIADKPTIFGEVNEDYVARELEWYRSLSLNVNDIPGGPPAIWQQVADKNGMINSNYGWCVYSNNNGNQFTKVVQELCESPLSRRAVMIYTRPTMHEDYKKNGMSDFMCTNTVQYYLRRGMLHASVYMRSNDAIFGYKNDYAWQKYLQKEVLDAINRRCNSVYSLGDLFWNVSSLHVYERHFKLMEQSMDVNASFDYNQGY
ncbi:dCMP hydroxymethylase [Lake Baikal phage Baikal-20-5m-C28]|nr:dCMP hydroxymethylase [Lake Baikal phage Baikal-20-5m-C28]